jgi:hypothetical protein
LEAGQQLIPEKYCIVEANTVSAGHYVVLCGFARETEHYILRDPDPRTASLGLCSVKASVLDAARKAFGTDEDLLIVKVA